jgi:hypothetical protein
MALSDTQLVVLSAACQRPHANVYPLPLKLPGGAGVKVLESLLKRGLIEEIEAKREDTVWREHRTRGRLTLRATKAAFEALGITEAVDHDATVSAMEEGDAAVRSMHPDGDEPSVAGAGEEVCKDSATDDSVGETEADAEATSAQLADEVSRKRAQRRTRTDTKQAKLIAMLVRPEGATIEEIAKAFAWQAHTVRGAIAGALKKKLGLNIGSEKDVVRGRVYRIIE